MTTTPATSAAPKGLDQALAALHRAGVTLSLSADGERVVVKPKPRITDAVRAVVAAHRPDLLAHLRSVSVERDNREARGGRTEKNRQRNAAPAREATEAAAGAPGEAGEGPGPCPPSGRTCWGEGSRADWPPPPPLEPPAPWKLAGGDLIYRVADDCPLPPVYVGLAVYYATERAFLASWAADELLAYHRAKVALFGQWPGWGWVSDRSERDKAGNVRVEGARDLAKRVGVSWRQAQDVLELLRDAGIVLIWPLPGSETSYCLSQRRFGNGGEGGAPAPKNPAAPQRCEAAG